jgi:predicted RNA-binding protein YlqC (UPF0109 family)
MAEPAIASEKRKAAIDELREMLEAIAKGLVDQPEEIVVLPAPGDGFVHFEIRCDHDDVGTLLGRRAVHAEAIRTLMMSAGAIRSLRVTLQILGHEGDHSPR